MSSSKKVDLKMIKEREARRYPQEVKSKPVPIPNYYDASSTTHLSNKQLYELHKKQLQPQKKQLEQPSKAQVDESQPNMPRKMRSRASIPPLKQ